MLRPISTELFDHDAQSRISVCTCCGIEEGASTSGFYFAKLRTNKPPCKGGWFVNAFAGLQDRL